MCTMERFGDNDRVPPCTHFSLNTLVKYKKIEGVCGNKQLGFRPSVQYVKNRLL